MSLRFVMVDYFEGSKTLLFCSLHFVVKHCTHSIEYLTLYDMGHVLEKPPVSILFGQTLVSLGVFRVPSFRDEYP